MEHISQIIKQTNPKIIQAVSMVNSSSPENECSICGGSGWLHPIIDGVTHYDRTIPCSCMREQLRERRNKFLLESCKFPPGADAMTFEKFRQYPELKFGYDAAKDMASKPGNSTWLALLGNNGTGKTHLGVAICRAWVKAGCAARYALVSLLLDELREGFRENDGAGYPQKFNYYCTVPLLMLDDLGMESKTGWVQEKLETIVDTRLMNNLSLIITSNDTLDAMPHRIRSRIIRHPNGQVISMGEKDFSLRNK